MNTVAENTISSLSRGEKVELLQWLVKDLGDNFAGIESTPDVCGAVACIVRTRIPVWVLENARRLGTSEADLLRDYPTLTAQDLANAWGYVRSHSAEIDEQIRVNEANAKAENQADFESDMLSLANDTANIPPYNGTYSREEIYFDHD